MKIKVCGMKYPENIKALLRVSIDYMGLIFYDKSSRYVDSISGDISYPDNIKRVGVFVNPTLEYVSEKVQEYGLSVVQLHGAESVDFCEDLKKENPTIQIIKAFNVADIKDFDAVEKYESTVDFCLFDTKTKHHGGSGLKFDWQILNNYKGNLPFFLSGGISENDVLQIQQINHPKLYALDINSRFELSPGMKDIEKVHNFIKNLK